MAKKSNRLPEPPRLDEMRAVAAQHGGKFTLLDRNGNMVIPPIYDFIGKPEAGVCLVRKDGKYGFVKTDGTVIVEPTYEKAAGFRSERAAVSVNGKWGFIDTCGNIVVEPQFDAEPYFCDGLAAVNVDGKWGYIDFDGKFIVQLIYESASAFDSGLGAVKLNGKIGFVSETGEMVISPQFDNVQNSALSGTWQCDALAVATLDGAMGIIDKKGQWVLPAKYGKVSLLMSMARCRQTVGDEVIGKFEVTPGGTGFVSTAGRLVTQPIFKEISEFSDGIAVGQDDNGLWGYIDINGEWVIKPQFASAKPFRGALANVSTKERSFSINKEGKEVGPCFKTLRAIIGTTEDIIPDRYIMKKDDKWGLVDGELNQILPFEFDDIERWGDTTNIIVSKDSNYGLVDINGVELLPVKFESIDIIRPNSPVARVVESRDGLCGAINAEGRWVVQPVYSGCNVYGDSNCIVVEKDESEGLLDMDGNVILPCSLDKIYSFTDGMACAQKDGKSGVISKDGNWIIQPEFEDVEIPYEGLAAAKKDAKWGFVNLHGEWVIAPEWKYIDSYPKGFVGGVIIVKDDSDKLVLINKRGEALTKPSSTVQLYAVADGMRRVKVGRKYGYLTDAGEIAIKPTYDEANDFENGWAMVNMKVDKQPVWTFINHEGCYGPTFEQAIRPIGLTKVKENNKIALLDPTGVMIAPFIFSRVDDTRDEFIPAQIAGF